MPAIVQRSSSALIKIKKPGELLLKIRRCGLASDFPVTRRKLSKILMISPDKCIGCRTCEVICSLARLKLLIQKLKGFGYSL